MPDFFSDLDKIVGKGELLKVKTMLSKKEADSEVYMDVNGWVLKP